MPPHIKHMVIISLYEANKLVLAIQKPRTTTLRLDAPRRNLSFPTLDTLDLYTIG